MDIMFDVARQPTTNCMELYLEREPVCSDNQSNVRALTPIDQQIPREMTTQDMQVDSFLDPGPTDNTVLVLQNQHRSEAIWAGEDPGVLTCRQRLATMMREWQLDRRIRRFVIQSGFYGIYRIGFIQIDWPLITALVERWRQETHTFHFVVGESTVTLQDVAVLLGLQVHGHAVSGNSDLQWDDLCEELLGLRPDRNVLHGSALKLSWLRANFQRPPQDADESTLQCYARAYILGLMGGVLFTDKSGADVQLIFLPLLRDFSHVKQFSWGSAALAHLYRELCRASKMGASEIAGPLILLQLWAWERMCIGRPEKFGARMQDPIVPDDEDTSNIAPVVDGTTIDGEQQPVDPLGCKWRFPVIRRDNPQRALIFYRDQLDQQTDEQMTWQPYTSERLASLPDICIRDQHVWQTIAPLVCFDIVEWHQPDRVLRQFGLHQAIPVHCDTEVKLHAIDRRGRHHYDWQAYHGRYIQLWEAREENIATGEPEGHTMHYHDPYMEWYRSITRRLITPLTQRPHMRIQPSSGMTHLLVQSLTTIHSQCTTTLGALTSQSATRALTDIQIMCTRVLEMIGETRHLEAKPSPAKLIHEEGEPLQAPLPSLDKAPSFRGRGRGKQRGKGRRMQSLRSASSPRSSPPLVVLLPTDPQRGNDLEEPAYPDKEEIATPAESVPNQPVAEPMHILEDEKEVEVAATPPTEPMDMLESIKEMETTQTLLQETSKGGLSELAELELPYEDRPKKKKKLRNL
nr:serine/threonine-protein phosphatase 7 long form homolog isoform X2 [Ziziphus jujuba var. spinosa]